MFRILHAENNANLAGLLYTFEVRGTVDAHEIVLPLLAMKPFHDAEELKRLS